MHPGALVVVVGALPTALAGTLLLNALGAAGIALPNALVAGFVLPKLPSREL